MNRLDLALVLVAVATAGLPASAPCQTPPAASPVQVRVLPTRAEAVDAASIRVAATVEFSSQVERVVAVYGQIRVAGGPILEGATPDSLLRRVAEIRIPGDGTTLRRDGLAIEFSASEIATARNLPRDAATIVWIDASVWDTVTKTYLNSNFDTSTPVIITTDAEGRVVSMDHSGAFEALLTHADAAIRQSGEAAFERHAGRERTHATVYSRILAGTAPEASRRFAALRLAGLAADMPALRPALRAALADRDPWVALYAVEGMIAAEKAADLAAPAVALLARPEIAARARDVVAAMGEAVRGPLVEALRKGDAESRLFVASALADPRVDPAAGAEALLDLLASSAADGGGKLELMIESELLDLSKEAAAALPVLRRAMAEGPAIIRIVAARAAFRVAALPESAATLAAALGDELDANRRRAAEGLGEMGAAAAAAVPALIEAMSRDASDTVRAAAALALGAIGPAARDAVPALARIATDAASPIRTQAGSALRKIDPEAARKAGL